MRMKISHFHLPLNYIKNDHPEYEMRAVKSMQNIAHHLNQNFQPNIISHLTYRREGYLTQKKEKIKSKSKNSICPILQPQQPENYLYDFDRTKQGSMIFCKSQPLKVTRCKRLTQCHKHLLINKNPENSRSNRLNLGDQLNDNKKTRKHIITPKLDFQTEESLPKVYNEYYRSGNYKNISNINEKTLKRNYSKCPHKKSNKRFQNTVSLENLETRLTLCETYIDMGERNIQLLAKQVDFLLRKEQERYQRKIKRDEERLEKGHKRQHDHHEKKKKQYDETTYHAEEEGKRRKNKDLRTRQSPSKFHYRSCEMRQWNSRMRQLIYFHQKDISSGKRNISLQNNQPSVTYSQINQQNNQQTPQQQTKQQISINDQVDNNHKNTSFSVRNNQKFFNNNNFKIIKTESRLDNLPYINTEQHLKSDTPPDNQSSEYLLQEYENDILRQTKHQTINPNSPLLHQKLNFSPINFPFLFSQHLPFDRCAQQGGNDYFTNEFEISQTHQTKSINPQILPFSRKNLQNHHHESSISNQSSAKSNRSRKVGQFTQSSQINESERASQKSNLQNTMQKFIQPKNHRVNSNPTSQRQYTLMNHSSAKKSNPSAQFQIIESNFSSPSQIDYNISSNDTEAQLIKQFDRLVIAAAEEGMPMKKKLIREQIYRTSQQVKYLRASREQLENNSKLSRSIQDHN